MPVYLTAAEYASITGRPEAEAEDRRIEQATQLLDARIGAYTRQDDGYKLEISALEAHKATAARTWVARMVAYLHDHDDEPPSGDAVTLGRFSVRPSSSGLLPAELRFADQQLVGAGLVNTRPRPR